MPPKTGGHTANRFSDEEWQTIQLMRERREKYGSITQIKKNFYPNASYGTLSRALKAESLPRKESTRKSIGLPPLVHAHPCPICGREPHYCKGCAKPKTCPHKRRKRPPRIAIRKDDVSSAAASIKNNCPPEFVRALAEELER